MARLSLFLTLLVVALVLLALAEVGHSRGHRWRGHGRGRRRHGNFFQRDKDEDTKDKDTKHRDTKDKDTKVEEMQHRARNSWSRLYRDMKRFFGDSKRMRSSFPGFLRFLDLWGQRVPLEEPWWKGPNVCEDKSENWYNDTNTKSEMMRHVTTATKACDESDTVYKCTTVEHSADGKRVAVDVYSCCHGYSRERGDVGCPQRVSMVNLIEKAKELGLTDFVKAVKVLKLTQELEQGNFTVFIPENGAFGLDSDLLDSGNGILLKDAPSVVVVSEPAVDQALADLQNVILGHMIQGAIRSSNMEDEEIFETGNAEGSTIRINYFSRPEKLMMANCVPVVSRDHIATNGVIHSVKKGLRPVTQSLLDIVKTRPDLSELKTLLALVNYVPTLEEDGKMTLLAPSNAAFERMNVRLREKLLRGDKKCLEKVLQNHLLTNVICSTAIQGQARTPNLLQLYLNVTRTEDDKVFVNGAQVIQSDVMGTNGVMHVIDDVLVPDSALDLLDSLEENGFTELINLVERAGLTKALQTNDSFTIFAPTNEAIQSLPIAVKTKLGNDADLLKDVLTYHVSPGVHKDSSTYRDQLLPQLLPTLQGKEIRTKYSVKGLQFFTHKFVQTAQCVPVSDTPIEACNGLIKTIGKVMMPPVGNVIDVLASNKKFSTFVSFLKKAGLADELQGNGPFTIFAPNNEAFEKADPETMARLEQDPKDLERFFLKQHIFMGTICCADFASYCTPFHSTERNWAGYGIRLCHKHGRTLFGSAKVLKCDMMATNGNVHEINEVQRMWPIRHRHNMFRHNFFHGY